jgi:PIN domain nuclease of toxin-antitoxin system
LRLLLDTHALLWWFSDHPALSPKARGLIADSGNELFVSAASAWEMAIKSRAGKLDAGPLLDNLVEELVGGGFHPLPISVDHAVRAGALPEHHRDPFDRMLIAQAQAENLAILSNDEGFARYGIRRIW